MKLFKKKEKIKVYRTLVTSQLITDAYKSLSMCRDFQNNNYTVFIDEFSILDLAKAPHLLVAGATGSGKSVCINSILINLLVKNTPRQMILYIIDPKKVDYIKFKGLPHLKGYADDVPGAAEILKNVYNGMMTRFKIMQDAGVDHIDKLGLPHVFVVFDEFASLMSAQGKKALLQVLNDIARLGRAAGVHLILATQRPDRSAIGGQLKSNIPTRICFKVMSATDSRIVLDKKGGENLRGSGDGLLLKANGDVARIQGLYTPEIEMDNIINWWKDQR